MAFSHIRLPLARPLSLRRRVGTGLPSRVPDQEEHEVGGRRRTCVRVCACVYCVVQLCWADSEMSVWSDQTEETGRQATGGNTTWASPQDCAVGGSTAAAGPQQQWQCGGEYCFLWCWGSFRRCECECQRECHRLCFVTSFITEEAEELTGWWLESTACCLLFLCVCLPVKLAASILFRTLL